MIWELQEECMYRIGHSIALHCSILEKPKVEVPPDARVVGLSGTVHVQNGTDAVSQASYGGEDRRELGAVRPVNQRTVKRVMRVRFHDESG